MAFPWWVCVKAWLSPCCGSWLNFMAFLPCLLCAEDTSLSQTRPITPSRAPLTWLQCREAAAAVVTRGACRFPHFFLRFELLFICKVSNQNIKTVKLVLFTAFFFLFNFAEKLLLFYNKYLIIVNDTQKSESATCVPALVLKEFSSTGFFLSADEKTNHWAGHSQAHKHFWRDT